MGYAAGGAFKGAPRFVMFFIGGSYHSPSVRPRQHRTISRPRRLRRSVPHAQDLIVFQGMRIHGGSPKKRRLPRGARRRPDRLLPPANDYHYSKNDSYFAYTDHESIDIAIANAYQARPELRSVAVREPARRGRRALRRRQRRSRSALHLVPTAPAGDAQYGNAMEPVQNAGQVYDQLMQRVSLLCAKDSNQPVADNSALQATLLRKKSVLDFRLADVDAAKTSLGMDSEHAHKLDGLLDGWRAVEKANDAELAAAGLWRPRRQQYGLPYRRAPPGNGQNKNSLDDLTSVHDQMIELIKLAFTWDLTRVVAFTLSGCFER